MQILIDKDRKILNHRLPPDNRIGRADTDAGTWIDPDTEKPIGPIPAKLKGTRRYPAAGCCYLLSSGLIPGIQPCDGCALLDETPDQLAALDAVDAEYFGKVDDYQRKIEARDSYTLASGVTLTGWEPTPPGPRADQFLSPNTGAVVRTKPAKPTQTAKASR